MDHSISLANITHKCCAVVVSAERQRALGCVDGLISCQQGCWDAARQTSLHDHKGSLIGLYKHILYDTHHPTPSLLTSTSTG